METAIEIDIRKRPTKRRHIYEALREQILSKKLPPHSAIPPAREMAKRFGVSYVTMHSALADLAGGGLLVRHNGKGTFVAETDGEQKRPLTSRLALILPVREELKMTEEFCGMLCGCSEGGAERGAELSVVSLPSFPPQAEISSFLPRIMSRDGALFLSTQYAPIMAELSTHNFPFVTIERSPAPAYSCVQYDRDAAVRLGVGHLIEHGYRRIGFFGTIRGEYAEKYGMFQAALEKHGIPLDTRFVQHCATLADAPEAARIFANSAPFPEAVFVDNYRKATTLGLALKERGLAIPQDLAIMAYGIEMANESIVPLSLVAIPYQAMGHEAAVQLDRLVRGLALPPVCKALQANLILHTSCGCHAARAVHGDSC